MIKSLLFHVKTQDLVQNGDDYWVRLKDLTTQSSLIGGRWQSDATYLLPHVSTDITYTNGMLNTYYMLKDCYDTGRASDAAMAAINSKYVHNEVTHSGFVPTRPQLDILLTMYQEVYTVLNFFGYTGSYRTKNIWISTQNSSGSAWSWRSAYWFNRAKSDFSYVIPAFTI